ncbi:hypothetical protein R1sor_023324 [Riccia sorocarpa]|uniref:Reverse transcriptase zinc-binding domain-containing protein n=1 Tax=Riccia sorocarpa TaxID=122646 RepID=A0ABD3GMG1_9MARC
MAGLDIKEGEITSEMITRLKRRIGAWENVYLSWPARALLIKHILSQIPVYTMMAIGTSRQEALKLEKVCREFLWGVTETGKVKKSLIAWRRLIQSKELGGLGLRSFESRAAALQMRHVAAVLDAEPKEWVWMLTRIMKIKLLMGPYKRERMHWEGGDAMLMLDALRITDAPTVDRILRTWFSFKKHLRLSTAWTEVPGYLHIGSIRTLWCLTGRDGEFETWLSSLKVVNTKLAKVEGWIWQQKRNVGDSWGQTAKFWANLTEQGTPLYRKLNRNWGTQSTPSDWKDRWRRLWQGSSLPKHKLEMWRTLQQEFATLDRASKWGVSDGICQICHKEKETLIHLMWECSGVRDRVLWIAGVVGGSRQASFIMVLDEALKAHKTQPMAFILLWIHCYTCWKERNKLVFEGKLSRIPEWQLLKQCRALEAVVCRKFSGEVRSNMEEKVQEFFRQAEDLRRIMQRRTRLVQSILGDVGILPTQSRGSTSEGDRSLDSSLDSSSSESSMDTTQTDSFSGQSGN